MAHSNGFGDAPLSPSEIITVLKENGLALTSRRGQNFLVDRAAVERILEYAGLGRSDTVLEVGPGLGALTLPMAARVKTVAAVELDRGLYRVLGRMLESRGVENVRLAAGDFVRLRPEQVLAPGSGTGAQTPGTGTPGAVAAASGAVAAAPGKSVSNFPYSAGIKSLIRILEQYPSVRLVTGTVQRELAERVTARPGSPEYSFVSVYVQFRSRISVLERRLGPDLFFPRPEVDSSIITMERVEHEDRDFVDLFKRVARAAFATRRKNLVNNLRSLLPAADRGELAALAGRLFGRERVRAEELTVEDFVRLAEALRSSCRDR